jgi:diguanylate cyclase (GGDEF)-like protein
MAADRRGKAKASPRPKLNKPAAKRARRDPASPEPEADRKSTYLTPARAEAMQLAAEVARLERELADARAQMAELAARAETDALTDVLNRRGFERELKRSLAYVKRYGISAALIYVDLDAFKRINDRYGHAAGDAMLKAVAMVLTRHVRASDLAARLGGDEFVLLLWNCGEADAVAKAEALEAAIARTTATHVGALLSVGASCGTAPILPLDQPAELLQRADRAMYARKALRNDTAAAE